MAVPRSTQKVNRRPRELVPESQARAVLTFTVRKTEMLSQVPPQSPPALTGAEGPERDFGNPSTAQEMGIPWGPDVSHTAWF